MLVVYDKPLTEIARAWKSLAKEPPTARFGMLETEVRVLSLFWFPMYAVVCDN